MTPTPCVDPDAFRAFEHRGWESAVAVYANGFGNLTSQAVEPLLDAARGGPGQRVLDVACRPGWLAAAAAERWAMATGVDFSPAMVAEARRRHPEIEMGRD